MSIIFVLDLLFIVSW